MSAHRLASARRLRWAPLSLVAGVLATGTLALSMNGTLAAFTASIAHNGNSANTGTLTMQEANSGATVTCNSTDGSGNGINGNAATCTGINHWGGANLVPGGSSTATVTIKNTGTVTAAGFTINFGGCTQGTNAGAGNVAGNATDLCSKLSATVTQTVSGTTSTVSPANSTLQTLAGGTPNTGSSITLSQLAAGASVSFTFTTTLPSAAGNTYQGLSATQPITFQFTS